jgi:2-succinyl-5-enolpyruvyl-6-hydroxy-3-cyclohexene-1-carboxylate synthase
MTLIASMQSDSYFEMYSSVDERSAAYMACGLAAESGEAVVISCTGATASRNYLSGLTEAYYRKLPVLAITSTQLVSRVGHHIAQVIDRSVLPKDVVKYSVTLPFVKDDEDLWDCEIKTNRAILELKRHGGGPAHINLQTNYSALYETKQLPRVRVLDRFYPADSFPELPVGRVAVFIGAHSIFTKREEDALDAFCKANNAVVFCDHTSGYRGQNRLLYALAAGQQAINLSEHQPDLVIHIGEVTGDYYSARLCGKQVWRVSPDGEIRDTFRRLRYVFEMPEQNFFKYYAERGFGSDGSSLKFYQNYLEDLRGKIPDLPLSNPWLASQLAHRIPADSVIHFGILNSLRSWNFFDLPESVRSACNVGGFGIDGCISSLLGASLSNPDKLYFGVVGDLATFYDLNSLGNRHVHKNIRILMVNNGKGTEFKQFNHSASEFGEDGDKYIAAGGHFGNKSRALMMHYAQDLGFEYLSASTKEEFAVVYERFLTPEITDRPMLFEVFTDSEDESVALEKILSIEDVTLGQTARQVATQVAKQALGAKGVSAVKKLLGR